MVPNESATPSKLKLVMYRSYALRRPTNRLQGKIGGAIAVAGRRGQVEALTVINNYFLGQGITPIGIGVDGRGSEEGDVEDDERAVKGVTELGIRLIQLIKAFR